MKIENKNIGAGNPCYIIAEMSANHNNQIGKAKEIIREAKQAGADAIKLQTYTADTLTIDVDNQYFKIADDSLWGGMTLHQLYSKAYTPWEWHPELIEEAHKVGITLFSSPFDETAVDFLEKLEIPVYKIASFELVDIPLLEKVAGTEKPVIISTGMATLEEIETAIKTLKKYGSSQIALLKCVSSYPAIPSEMNLQTITHMQQHFGTIAGLSDHTLGSIVSITAVAIGASIIEKHFTLSRKEESPDSSFSMEPEEFRKMVDDIRTAETAIGHISYGTTVNEQKSIKFRRSIFAVQDISVGEVFTKNNIRIIRPGFGMAPSNLNWILGKKALVSIRRGTPVQLNQIIG